MHVWLNLKTIKFYWIKLKLQISTDNQAILHMKHSPPGMERFCDIFSNKFLKYRLIFLSLIYIVKTNAGKNKMVMSCVSQFFLLKTIKLVKNWFLWHCCEIGQLFLQPQNSVKISIQIWHYLPFFVFLPTFADF